MLCDSWKHKDTHNSWSLPINLNEELQPAPFIFCLPSHVKCRLSQNVTHWSTSFDIFRTPLSLFCVILNYTTYGGHVGSYVRKCIEVVACLFLLLDFLSNRNLAYKKGILTFLYEQRLLKLRKIDRCKLVLISQRTNKQPLLLNFVA